MTATNASDTTEYSSWKKMRSRCNNPRNRAYKNYGGRGIKVCERWMHSFATFLADMGPKPTPKHSIDRIDNNRGYSPDNCRWATAKQQRNNTRTNRLLTYRDRTQTISQWCDELGIPHLRVWQRLSYGWSVADALECGRLTARRGIKLTLHGKSQCLADWCREYGVVSYCTALHRLKVGWSLEEAITLPARSKIKSRM